MYTLEDYPTEMFTYSKSELRLHVPTITRAEAEKQLGKRTVD